MTAKKKKPVFISRNYTRKNMPRCFSSVFDWKEWNRLNIISEQRDCTICTDCLPTFKQRMVGEDRCDHPKTKFMFILDREGEPGQRHPVGYRPKRRKQ